ncbi:MAG TPA: AraC family transcriptional regulator [Polyangiaceae bacterium]|nr:AraC family transcriptional regulator [Polyangiaceae bacterium]
MAASTHTENRSIVGGGLASASEAPAWQSLGPVLAAADELASFVDTDQMLRRAVEVARERIGLERVGLFLRDPRAERTLLRGTWGTGANGQTTDEHSVHHEYDADNAESLRSLQHNGALWQQLEGPLQCVEDPRRNVEFGYGWLVVTPLVSARELVGVMYNDSALSRSPVDELKQVRMAVFCSHLATLFLHRRNRFDWPVRPTTQKSPWVRSVLRALDEDPCSSGASLARELSISPGYLARSFKSEMGISLVEYRHRRLMARFFEAVERGQANLLAAALDAGFSSYTQFHRVYRRMFGKSPRDDMQARLHARAQHSDAASLTKM